MVRVVVNNGQYKITIPKDLAESRGWTKGTKILFVEGEKGDIILREFKKK